MSTSDPRVSVIVSTDISGVKPGMDAVNAQLAKMALAAKGAVSASTISVERFSAGISDGGEKFRRVNAEMDRAAKTAEQNTKSFSGQSFAIRNAAYQITDFAVQVQSGQRVTTALSQQLPQLLVGFGTFGAVAGIAASVLPGLVAHLWDVDEGGKTLSTTAADLRSALSDVGDTARSFSMDRVYQEFNGANEIVRENIVEQTRFQKTLIETRNLIAQQALSKSLDGVADFSTMDKLRGAFGSTGSEKLARDLGVSLATAQDMLPAIRALRDGSEDASNFIARFGTELAGSRNTSAQKLINDIKAVAEGSRDAAAAQSKLSAALKKMEAAGSTGKIVLDEGTKTPATGGKSAATATATEEARAYASAMQQISAAHLSAQTSGMELTVTQRRMMELFSDPIFARMPEAWRSMVAAEAEAAIAAEQMAAQQLRLNELLGTTALEKARQDMLLLADALREGSVSEAEYIEAVKRRLNEVGEAAKKSGDTIETVISNAFKGAAGSLADFALTGKASFGSLVESMIRDLLRLEMQSAMTSMWKGMGGASGILSGVGSWLSGLFASADGNVFSGAPGLHQYVNTVQSSPRVFGFDRVHAFASGGIFAEAGPEAVMPLSRHSSGRLGVDASGMSPKVNIQVVNQGASDGYEAAVTQRTNGDGIDLVVMFRREFGRDLKNNGPMAKMLASTFGQRRAV